MAARLTGSRRGFFFTVMALAILSFMLLSTQIWIRSFQRSDENSAARFKGEAMRLVLSSLSDNQLSRFANASAYYATYKLANYSSYPYHVITQGVANDTQNPGTGNVEKAIKALIVNGSAVFGSGPADQLNYTGEEKQSYTIDAWKQKVNDAANIMGFRANFSDPRNLTVRQLDPWTVGVSFEMDMNVSDMEGTMQQAKTVKAKSNFSIEGFPDPSITRNDILQRKPTPVESEAEQKQVFANPAYPTPASIASQTRILASGSEGNGWFAGPVTDNPPGFGIFTNATEQARMWQYIYYVQSYYPGLESDANLYGAVIIASNPGVNNSYNVTLPNGCKYNITRQTNCLNCKTEYITATPGCERDPEYTKNVSVPVIAAGGFSINSIPFVHRNGLDSQSRYALLDNEFRTYQNKKNGYHRIWDLTGIRDMTVCGFYVHDDAPSFFQRMLKDTGVPSSPGTVHSADYGIETLLLGAWAGGWLDKGTANSFDDDKRSRLDWQFYSAQTTFPPQTTFKIKGMAGCRTEQMCQDGNNSAITESTGKFRLTDSVAAKYGLDRIACNPALGSTGNCQPLGD